MNPGVPPVCISVWPCIETSFHVLSKVSGQLHSVKGTAVETVGSMTGSTDWQQAGKQEHASGEAEYKAAQAEGYAEGTTDRLRGKKDSVVGSVTGDKKQEVQGEEPIIA